MGTSAEPVPRRIEQEAVSEAGERSSIIKADKKAGKLVGPYLVGELIGEGTQGKVKEAVHSETLRRVAIKIVNKLQLRKIKNAEENMKRELKIHRRLKHEHVVELLEVLEIKKPDKEKQYIVLELINGGSLQDILDELPTHVLPVRLAARIGRQLFRGLEYIHSKGCPKDIPEDFREGEAYAHRGHSVDAYMAALCNDSVQFPTRLALIKWLHERGYSLEGSYAMEVALKDDDLPMVGALMALGVPFDADFFTSDRWNQYETRADQCYESYAVVEWARNQGWEIPKDKWPNGPTVPNTLAE